MSVRAVDGSEKRLNREAVDNFHVGEEMCLSSVDGTLLLT
jgi:hypothetical protein